MLTIYDLPDTNPDNYTPDLTGLRTFTGDSNMGKRSSRSLGVIYQWWKSVHPSIYSGDSGVYDICISYHVNTGESYITYRTFANPRQIVTPMPPPNCTEEQYFQLSTVHDYHIERELSNRVQRDLAMFIEWFKEEFEEPKS